MSEALDWMAWSADFVEGGRAISSELVVQGQVRLSVLFELKEASRVVFNVSVAEVVELVAKGVADVLLEFRTVLCKMLVELACGILEFVSCSSCLTLANNLIDTALHIGSSQVLNLEQE